MYRVYILIKLFLIHILTLGITNSTFFLVESKCYAKLDL